MSQTGAEGNVALGTGLRLGELRALRWRDVDRERRLIRVERAVSRRELKRPKTEAGSRSVPLFPSVRSALTEAAARALELGRYAPEELVFATVRGTPLHESNFNRRVWRPALERAGLTDIGYRFHDLRHTCVSRLVAAGGDVKARPGGRRPLEPDDHAQPLLAPARRADQRSGRSNRPVTRRSVVRGDRVIWVAQGRRGNGAAEGRRAAGSAR